MPKDKKEEGKREDSGKVSKEDFKKSEERCPVCGKSVWDCSGHKK